METKIFSVKYYYPWKDRVFQNGKHVVGFKRDDKHLSGNWASLVVQRLKRLPEMWETWVRSLGWEDPLEKAMAPHSSTLAWRIPWMEEPGGLQSTGSQRVGHDWATSLTHSGNIQMNVVVWSLSRVWLLRPSWTVACQAPLSMGFPRQAYWTGLPFFSPGDLHDPGTEPTIGRGFLYHWATS